MAFYRRRRHGQVGTGNGVVSQVAQRVAGTGVKLQVQVVAPITVAVADVDNRISNGQNVSANGDNYDQIHIVEVIERSKARTTTIASYLSSRAGCSNR